MSEQTTETFYDRISGAYDLLANANEKESRNLGLKRLSVRRGERALEIGSGTGHALVELAKQVGKEGHVTGIDISEGMCGRARDRVEESGLAGRVTILRASVPPLPFADDAFDAVFMSYTLEIFPLDVLPAVLREIARVLRDGGRIAVVALTNTATGAEPNSIQRSFAWMHRHFPHIVDCTPIDADAWLADCGFKIGQVERTDIWGLPVMIVTACCDKAGMRERTAPGTAQDDRIEALVRAFTSKHIEERIGARHALAAMGRTALPRVSAMLENENHQDRWEAAKCIQEMKEPASIPLLLRELSDRESGIRWIAGNALVGIGEKSIEPVVRGLLELPAPEMDSYVYAIGAHHVLRELAQQCHAKLLDPLLDALSMSVRSSIVVEAGQVLDRLRRQDKPQRSLPKSAAEGR